MVSLDSTLECWIHGPMDSPSMENCNVKNFTHEHTTRFMNILNVKDELSLGEFMKTLVAGWHCVRFPTIQMRDLITYVGHCSIRNQPHTSSPPCWNFWGICSTRQGQLGHNIHPYWNQLVTALANREECNQTSCWLLLVDRYRDLQCRCCMAL